MWPVSSLHFGGQTSSEASSDHPAPDPATSTSTTNKRLKSTSIFVLETSPKTFPKLAIRGSNIDQKLPCDGNA